jgi:hypothetical protein
MIRTIRLIVSMLAFLVIFAFVIAPALAQFVDAINPFLGGSIGSGVVNDTETALFLGMPLLLLGGILLLGFVIAAGLRGTFTR